MSALASGWNTIVRKKTLEDNNFNLRKVEIYPGTGPFISKRRVENEVWVFEEEQKLLEQPAALSRRHRVLPCAAVLDRASRLVDPVGPHRLHPHHRPGDGYARPRRVPGFSRPRSSIRASSRASGLITKKPPLDDPRVAQGAALHLRPPGADRGGQGRPSAPMQVGGFIYPFSEFATPKDELFKRLGYQSDTGPAIKAAKELLAAAWSCGRAQVSRSISSSATWPASSSGPRRSRRCCKEGAQHQVQPAHGRRVGVVRRCRQRAFRAWRSARVVSTLLDPSDYFNAWYRTGGPQNYSQWSSKEFDALLDQIDSEVDPAKRLDLIRKTEAIMEQEIPVLPVAWERINDVYRDFVKGPQPGRLFRHLRCGARGHVLARQDLRDGVRQAAGVAVREGRRMAIAVKPILSAYRRRGQRHRSVSQPLGASAVKELWAAIDRHCDTPSFTTRT